MNPTPNEARFPPALRFRIGASLIPPFALLWLGARKGWIPLDPRWPLFAMPAALAIGFLLPAAFASWHIAFERLQAAVGRRIVAGLLALVWCTVILPVGLLLRLFGKRFLETRPRESHWNPARPHGSLLDGF